MTSTLAYPRSFTSLAVATETFTNLGAKVVYSSPTSPLTVTVALLNANGTATGYSTTATIASGDIVNIAIPATLTRPGTYQFQATSPSIPVPITQTISLKSTETVDSVILDSQAATTLVTRVGYSTYATPKTATVALMDATGTTTLYTGTASIASGGQVSITIPNTLPRGINYVLRATVTGVTGSVSKTITLTAPTITPKLTQTLTTTLPDTAATPIRAGYEWTLLDPLRGTLSNDGNIDLTAVTDTDSTARVTLTCQNRTLIPTATTTCAP